MCWNLYIVQKSVLSTLGIKDDVDNSLAEFKFALLIDWLIDFLDSKYSAIGRSSILECIDKTTIKPS